MAIQIITTGGTFDKVYFDALSEFSIGEPQAANILQQAKVNCRYQLTSLLKKDSLELTEADRALLSQTIEQSNAQQIVIIHGTDTMALSADYLNQARTAYPDKTIVLTGAMQPALMQYSDAPFNLGFALGAAQCLAAGIYIAMNGQIFAAGAVQKNRAAQCFEALEHPTPC